MLRRNLLRVLLSLCLALSFGFGRPAAAADALLVAAGAGYKRPITELAEAFAKQSGIRLEQLYGHMGGVLNQAKQSGQVAVIFGDLSFLEKTDIVTFASFLPLGDGRLVVAWPRGTTLQSAAELADARFARIAIPDAKAAIYGIAATEFLQRSGLESALRPRLQMASTVPQVTAYVVSGEIDAGFINLTEALAVRDRIGGYLEIDRALYSPIRIVGGVIKGFETQDAVKKLGAFLLTPEARAILDKYGL